MPKKVDLVERKNQIAAATWRVILKKGIDNTSFQNIANEANMSVGLIQHNFSSKEKILQYAMNLVINRIEERATKRLHVFSGTKEETLRNFLFRLIMRKSLKQECGSLFWDVLLATQISSNYSKRWIGIQEK